jgi:hypothetical protein
VISFPLLGEISRISHFPEVLIVLAGLTAFCVALPNVYEMMGRFRPALTDIYRGYRGSIVWRPTVAWSVAVAALLAYSIGSVSGVHQFIYVGF